MTKSDLIEKLANNAGTSKATAGKALDTLVDEITKTLKKGKKATFVGFGTFSVSKRKARKGVNPQTREKINIKATKVPKFKAGKALKDAIK